MLKRHVIAYKKCVHFFQKLIWLLLISIIKITSNFLIFTLIFFNESQKKITCEKKEASKSMYGLEKAVMYDNDWFMFSLILKKDCHNRT